MPKLPDVHEIKRSARDPYRYDFKQASQILEALDFLRREAVKTGIPEIMEMIDASYRLLCMSYYTGFCACLITASATMK
jgi:hypothetical protein